ncbi:hypothetical protein Q8W15_04690 [Photobacterium damselae subsp. piscicida]|nr:hypothetical protein [Photobacterium damselae subsp. piscicida]
MNTIGKFGLSALAIAVVTGVFSANALAAPHRDSLESSLVSDDSILSLSTVSYANCLNGVTNHRSPMMVAAPTDTGVRSHGHLVGYEVGDGLDIFPSTRGPVGPQGVQGLQGVQGVQGPRGTLVPKATRVIVVFKASKVSKVFRESKANVVKKVMLAVYLESKNNA